MRRVELWSVFRLSIFALFAAYAITLGAFALLWWIASNTGTVHNLEKFLRDVGFKNFHFDGPQLMAGFAAVGAVLVAAGTLLATVMAALFNVLSEMTGGVSVVVIEEAPVSTQPPGGTSLPVGTAGDHRSTHASPSTRSMANRGQPTTRATSAARSDGSGEPSDDNSGMVVRARSAMGVAAGKIRRSIQGTARGLAGDGLGADGSGGSGDGSRGQVGDGRGDDAGGSTVGSGGDPAGARSGADAAARSRYGEATE